MSITQDLNPVGQSVTAVLGTFIVNAAVQPLCTIKNLMMAKRLSLLKTPSLNLAARLKFLYRGYTAMCITESFGYAVCMVSNYWLKKHQFSSIASSGIAGAISAPVITIGEGVMLNRQLGNKMNLQLLKSIMTLSALAATLMREVPLSIAIFAAAPAIEDWIPIENDLAVKTSAGFLSGTVAGFVSGPFDSIKTLVQAKTPYCPNGMTLTQATYNVALEVTSKNGARQALLNSATRAIYVGLSVAILNVSNDRLPHHFGQWAKE